VKTISLRKKVVALAVAAVVSSGFSPVAPAQAVTGAAVGLVCETALTTTPTCTQVAGGTVVVTFTGATAASGSANSYNIVSSGVGTVGSAALTASTTLGDRTQTAAVAAALGQLGAVATSPVYPTNSFTYRSATYSAGTGGATNGAAGFDSVAFTATSTVAGTQTFTATKLDASGTPTTSYTVAVTWVAAASTDLASVAAYTLANNGTCNSSVTASTVGSMAYNLASGSALKLCVVIKNAAGNAFTRGTASVAVVGNGIGQVAGSAVHSTTTSSGVADIAIYGNGLPGTATFTITASATNADGTTTTSKTGSASVVANGDFTTISLANLKKSIALSGAAAGTIDYSATDVKGNAAAINLGSGATWYVESDKGTTAVSSTAPNNSSATVASAAAETITAATGASADDGRVTVTSGAAYEKLTIWVTKDNAAGATITSNKVVVFVSTAVTAIKTLNVTKAASTSGGGATTITIEALSDVATTKTAYPVVDGAVITVGATGGSLSATSVTTGVSGTATVTFYPSQVGGDAIVTITATDPTPDLATTTTVATTGSSLLTQIDALNAKIVALNALIAKIMKKLGVK